MPRNSSLMKPFVALAFPGMYLVYKYNQYKRQRQEQNRRKVTERELAHLNHKIDKLLAKLDENEPELAVSQEEECVICITARSTMQTYPCGHRVVCRKCFVKTIQTAVAQRMLPLRCVICRAKILRLKQSSSSGGDGDSLMGLSPSPSTESALSAAFSTCSSSFSLKSYDSDVSSRRSCKSAPPTYHLRSSSTNSSNSSTCTTRKDADNHRRKKTTAIAMAATVAAAPALVHLGNEPFTSQADTNTTPTPTPTPHPPPPTQISRGSKGQRNKLSSLPRATVRSRSPHKMQTPMGLHPPHRLEMIQEVVEEGDGRRRLTPNLC